MPDLTLRNVPAKLVEQLKVSAAANRRGLNSEILARLHKSVRGPVIDVAAELRALLDFIRGRPMEPRGRATGSRDRMTRRGRLASQPARKPQR
jgi:plasmid stability protein